MSTRRMAINNWYLLIVHCLLDYHDTLVWGPLLT